MRKKSKMSAAEQAHEEERRRKVRAGFNRMFELLLECAEKHKDDPKALTDIYQVMYALGVFL